MRLLKLFISVFIMTYFVACGSYNSTSSQIRKVEIKVSLPNSLQQKLLKIEQKPNVEIARVTLDVNSSSHIYMQNSPLSKVISRDGNYWTIVSKPLPIGEALSFLAKAYNNKGKIIFRGKYNGVIDNQLSDITMPLFSDNLMLEQIPSLRSIVFNNHDKTEITFNIYNPNADDLNYNILSSLGSFTPNEGVLNFSSSLKFYSLHVTFSPSVTPSSSSCQFIISNSDEEKFITLFTIDITPPEVTLKLKALYAQNNKLYAINDDKTLNILNSNLQLVKNKNTITKPTFMGESAYFCAYDETHGYEIWQSDGTSNGTKILKDINPNNNYYTPMTLINVGNKLYFSADDGTHGRELWKSDGTNAGTVMVKDINPNGGAYPSGFTNVEGTLYFSATDETHSQELWRSDGTANGTVKVKDINPNGNADVSYLTNVNGILYFRANDGTHGLALWRSNGTEEGTYMVKDNSPNNFDIYNLIEMNSILYFAEQNGNSGVNLWRSDGTPNGTYKIKTLNSNADAYLETIITMNNTLYFSIKDRDSSEQLWRSNGSSEGTYSISEINPTHNYLPTPIVSIEDILYFRAKDDYGYELWRSDGTEGGATLVKDINPSGHSFPTYLTKVDNLLYFVADDGVNGKTLWRSNGVESETIQVTLPE